MFRKEVFDRIGGYNNALPYAQDYDLWTRLSELTDFANIPKVLFQYRSHFNAVTRKKRLNQVSAHRGIRASFWARIEPEEIDTKKWSRDIKKTIIAERRILKQYKFKWTDLKKDLVLRRICEANLAYGAKRADIGAKCLLEVSMVYRMLPVRIFFLLLKLFGFYPLWKMVRWSMSFKLYKIIRNNSIFEW